MCNATICDVDEYTDLLVPKGKGNFFEVGQVVINFVVSISKTL